MEDEAGRLDALRKDAERSYFRAKNGIKYIAGIGRPKVGLTPRELIWTREKTRLFHYRGAEPATRRPPLVIVWSIASRSYILDLRPGQSFIEVLLRAGIDVFMVDWTEPGAVDSSNSLETYTEDYLPGALGAVMDATGSEEVNLLGYCFGGTLSLLSVAGHPGMPVRNLVVMATPINFEAVEGPVKALRTGDINIDDLLDDSGNIPADVLYRGFAVLRPTSSVANYANLWERMWNDAWVESYQALSQWLRDQVPLPGGVVKQAADVLVRRNSLMDGGLRLAGRRVALGDITCPLLNVMAEKDHIVPVGASEPLLGLVGSADATELRIPAGHISLATGRDALHITVPKIIEWLEARGT
jgi:polyhydroxyalkanoate synthase subunit PhaC